MPRGKLSDSIDLQAKACGWIEYDELVKQNKELHTKKGAYNMTPEQEKEFEDKLKESLEKARINGMSIGMKAVSKVIYDKTVNVNRECSKNDLLRVVKDIKQFCETGLAIKDQTDKQ